MTAPTTDNRPTDTIRDAFEAMIAFLTILIGGPMPRAWPDIAAVAARAIGSQARTTEEADRAVAALASFRDLIQRAAEEHNRRAAVGGDFTPERIREARERCERATPGPWVHSPPGVDEPHVSTKIGSDSDRVDWLASPRSAPSKRWHDAAFIAHAREDLPAALAEIERLNRLVVATANADPSWVERCTTQAAEIERLATALQAERAAWQEASGADSPGHLTAALKAYRAARAPADARVRQLCQAARALLAGSDESNPEAWNDLRAAVDAARNPSDAPAELAARAPADASLEARAEMVKEVLRASGVGLLVTHPSDGPSALQAVVRAVDASRPAAPEVDDDEPLPRGARVRTVAHLTALFSPSLHPHRRPNALGKIVRRMTSGDIYYDVRHDDGTVAGYERSELIDLTADASRPAVPSAADLRAITIDWPRTNARRGALMDREDAGTLTADEITELADLQRLADMLVDKMHRDASRPGLTEEQADAIALGCLQVREDLQRHAIKRAILRASRGETGPDDQAVCMAAAAKAGWTFDPATGRWTGPSRSDPAVAVEMRQWEADVDAAERTKLSRGETGAVPGGLTSIMHAAQQRPSVPPDPLALDPEDGTLCADCRAPRNAIHGALCSVRGGAKPGRVPDPRATLHDGNPESPFAPGSLAAGSATEDRILDRKRGGK